MYKQRDGGERYYWTPGHEILFYTQVNTQNVPQENPKAGVGGNNAIKLLRGVSWQKSRTSESYLPYAKFSFWKPFIRYKGGDTLLASADQLKTIYKDYRAASTSTTSSSARTKGIFRDWFFAHGHRDTDRGRLHHHDR